LGEKWLKFKIALVAIVSILTLSVAANGFLFSEKNSFVLDADLQRQANGGLQMRIVELQSQLSNLTFKTDDLQYQKTYLQDENLALEKQAANQTNQIIYLQNENANLNAKVADLLPYQPNRSVLVTRLGTTDVLNSSNAHAPYRQRLYVQGSVYNLGDQTAYNARLHVMLYIGDQIIADTFIELGNIEPLNWASVSRDIYYDAVGQRLTNWIIIPETQTS
jgi:hypothetical protein